MRSQSEIQIVANHAVDLSCTVIEIIDTFSQQEGLGILFHYESDTPAAKYFSISKSCRSRSLMMFCCLTDRIHDFIDAMTRRVPSLLSTSPAPLPDVVTFLRGLTIQKKANVLPAS
jgi:hypothetical protein